MAKKKTSPVAVAGLVLIVLACGAGIWWYQATWEADRAHDAELVAQAAQRRELDESMELVSPPDEPYAERWTRGTLVSGATPGTWHLVRLDAQTRLTELCLAVGGNPDNLTICQSHEVLEASETTVRLRDRSMGHTWLLEECGAESCEGHHFSNFPSHWTATLRPLEGDR